MLSDEEFKQLCERMNLSAPSITLISAIRSEPPARRVHSRRGNVAGRYPSRKMGFTIQWESRTVELPAIYSMEHDEGVLEFYDQPARGLKLNYIQGERMRGVLHTPDFFVITASGAGWEEWKDEDELQVLSEKSPNRYCRDEAGNWRCPPGEAAAAKWGLTYRVRTSKDIDYTLFRNVQFLEDYIFENDHQVPLSTEEAVRTIVVSNPGIHLDLLLKQVGQADDVYRLISREKLYVDLNRFALPERETVPIFVDKVTSDAYACLTTPTSCNTFSPTSLPVALEVGAEVLWHGNRYQLANVAKDVISLVSSSKNVAEFKRDDFLTLMSSGAIKGVPFSSASENSDIIRGFFSTASPQDLEEANRKFRVVEPFLKGRKLDDSQMPLRTLKDLLSKYRAAEQAYGVGYVGLLPHHARKGNRTPRLCKDVLDTVDSVIGEVFERNKQQKMFEVYGEVELQCEAKGLTPPSYKTFSKLVHSRPRYDQIFRRKGPRAAYSEAPVHRTVQSRAPHSGDWAMHKCHLDHTELDVQTRCSKSGKPLGKPYLSFMIDDVTRKIPSFCLSYDPPSYKSCMVVMRECVRKTQRLPYSIVVDGGKEFGSTYFETLLARFKVLKMERPPAEPRYGSIVERLFGTTNTRFIDNLLGNTQIMKNVRQVTKSVNPTELSVWTLEMLYVYLEKWIEEVYHNTPHPALGGLTPNEAWALHSSTSGQRPMTFIPYDEDFIMLTFPTTAKGTARVQPNHAIKISYLLYYAHEFRDPTVLNSDVPVRYDPYNIGYAYAYVKGRWIRCESEYHSVFVNRTERQLHIAVEELRKRAKIQSRSLAITAKLIAEFLRNVEHEETFQAQYLRDLATSNVIQMPLEREKGRSVNNEADSARKPTIEDVTSNNVVDINPRLNSRQRGGSVDINGLYVYDEE